MEFTTNVKIAFVAAVFTGAFLANASSDELLQAEIGEPIACVADPVGDFCSETLEEAIAAREDWYERLEAFLGLPAKQLPPLKFQSLKS